jgi:hypothetical protein
MREPNMSLDASVTAPNPRRELTLAGALLVAFFVVNLATAERSPAVWQDEVMFADPAVNYHQGRGFTSTAWFQPKEQFFAGNAPLHSLLLCPWLAAFGLGVASVRSLNYVLMLGAVAAMAFGLGRLGLIRTGRGLGWFLALALCGDGVAFSYRSGRYDCLGMLIGAGVFAALAVERPRLRAAAIALIAALIPWAGLQLIPYTALMCVPLLLLRGRKAIREVGAIAAGGALGAASLAGFFKGNDVWDEFLKSASILAGTRRALVERLTASAVAPTADLSSMLLLGALAVLLIAPVRRRAASPRAATVGLLLGLAVPCAVSASGRYPRYYAWMAFLPMAAAFASAFEQHAPGGRLRAAAASLALLACLVGFPARLALTCLEWDLRDAGPVDRFVASHVGPGDRVFSSYEAYYAAKKSAGLVFLPFYIGRSFGLSPDAPTPITREERDEVDVLILKPDAVEATVAFFGGEWRQVDCLKADTPRRLPLLERKNFGSRPYDLIIFRRDDGGPLPSGAIARAAAR